MESQHQNVENLWNNPQHILSENAYRILKVLIQLEKNKPGKVKVKDIRKIIVDLSTSEIYKCLKELESKSFAEHRQPYWILKGITKEKPSTEKPSFTPKEAAAISYFLTRDNRFWNNLAQFEIWLKRGAKPKEKPNVV